MMPPAARAALMAVLSMGWSACDMGSLFVERVDATGGKSGVRPKPYG